MKTASFDPLSLRLSERCSQPKAVFTPFEAANFFGVLPKGLFDCKVDVYGELTRRTATISKKRATVEGAEANGRLWKTSYPTLSPATTESDQPGASWPSSMSKIGLAWTPPVGQGRPRRVRPSQKALQRMDCRQPERPPHVKAPRPTVHIAIVDALFSEDPRCMLDTEWVHRLLGTPDA